MVVEGIVKDSNQNKLLAIRKIKTSKGSTMISTFMN
jgi:hypothetical protein